jgi:hypothetical protein
MSTTVRIPQGDDTVKVELTVKEAMALAGIKFPNDHGLEIAAKRKLHEAIDEHYDIEGTQPLN